MFSIYRITHNSTIVAPFEKNDILKLKTTNDIETCVLRKIFREKVPGALGIIKNSITGEF